MKSFWVANPNPFIISQPPASPSTMQLIQNRLFTYSKNFKQWVKAQQVQLLYRKPIKWNIHNLLHDILIINMASYHRFLHLKHDILSWNAWTVYVQLCLLSCITLYLVDFTCGPVNLMCTYPARNLSRFPKFSTRSSSGGTTLALVAFSQTFCLYVFLDIFPLDRLVSILICYLLISCSINAWTGILFHVSIITILETYF